MADKRSTQYKVWECPCGHRIVTSGSVRETIACGKCGERMKVVYMNRSPVRGVGIRKSHPAAKLLDLGYELLLEAAADAR